MKTVYLADPWRPEPAPSGQRVVTPNPRAARRMGAPFVSLEHLARRALPPGLGVAPPLVLARAHRAVLAERGSPDPAGEARAGAGAVAALLRSGADLEALERLGGRLAERAGEARALSERLAGDGLVHPAALLHRAAEHVRPEPLYLFGYPHLGFDQRAFLKRAAGDGSVLVLPDPEAPFAAPARDTAEALARAGWRVESFQDEAATPGERAARRFAGGKGGARVEVLALPDPEAEVRAVLARVKELLLRGVPAHRIALVARDDAAVGPLALAVAWEYGVPLRALYAVPLAETRLGAWVEALLEAATTGFPFEATARLLAHPLGPGLGSGAWADARREHPRGPEAWRALGAPEALFALPDRGTRGDLARALRGVLEALALRRRALPWPRELLAYHALLDGLAALPEPGEALTLEAFRADIAELLLAESVPAAPGRGGVELHTPLSLAGAAYDHLFVLGLSEGRFPPPVRDDPALDFFELRRAAGAGFPVGSPAEAAHREALHFFALLAGARERVVLAHNHRDGGPSPFLAPFGGGRAPEPVAASPEELRRARLQREGAGDPVLDAARAAWRVELAREGPHPPDAHDGVTGLGVDPSGRAFAVTELEALGRCPFRWFAGYLLGLAEPEEAPEALDFTLRGQLYHRTLARAVRPGEDPRRAGARLESAFREAERALGLDRLPGWAGERLEHLSRLRRLVGAGDFALPGAVVLAVERPFDGVEWRGFRVRGRLDRADRVGDEVVLYDYKAGKSAPDGVKDEEGRLKLDFQLPLYREVAPALFSGLKVGAAYYLLVGAAEARSVNHSNGALDALARRLRGHLQEGRFPVDPDVNQDACKFCPFDLVCRRGPRLWRKGGPA